jgi:long-subunit acyl-CoA synthetase (AMP-forming)
LASTIGEILPAALRRFGARPALIVGDRSFSFDELQASSDRVARGLVAAGVKPGDRVALYGPNCWEWLVAYYGMAKTGAVVIPINVMLTPDEVRFVVEDSTSAGGLTSRSRQVRCRPKSGSCSASSRAISKRRYSLRVSSGRNGPKARLDDVKCAARIVVAQLQGDLTLRIRSGRLQDHMGLLARRLDHRAKRHRPHARALASRR